jgi:hypothetical protein
VDLAIARNIRFWGSKQAQIRLEAFNAFNNVNINSRQTQLQLNSPSDPTVRAGTAQFNADGSINEARLTPRNAGLARRRVRRRCGPSNCSSDSISRLMRVTATQAAARPSLGVRPLFVT